LRSRISKVHGEYGAKKSMTIAKQDKSKVHGEYGAKQGMTIAEQDKYGAWQVWCKEEHDDCGAGSGIRDKTRVL